MGDVEEVLGFSFHVHIAGVPVAVFGLALGAPVSPEAELGVLEPFGGFVLFEGVPGGLEFSGGHGFGVGADGGGEGGEVCGVEGGGEGGDGEGEESGGEGFFGGGHFPDPCERGV